MSWIAGLGAAIMMFFGSVFGMHSQTTSNEQMLPVTPSPSQTTNSQQIQTSASPQAAGAQQYNSGSRNPSSLPPQSGQETQLMQQIGCHDISSCVSVCTQQTSLACDELRAAMSASYQTYSPGTPSGPGQGSQDHSVAYVGNGTAASAAALPDCPADNVLFDTSPIALSDFGSIEPLGNMNGEHILPNQADHVYLNAKSSIQSTEIYAPGNATLLQVNEQSGIAGADKNTTSVKLYFSPCKSVMFAFQISSLSPQLQAALDKVSSSGTQTGATVQNTVYGPLNIPLTSGENLGTITSYQGAPAGADFAAADVRTPILKFIDQSEQTGMLADSYAHAVCPLDYFNSSLQKTLTPLLEIQNAGDNGIPACGSVMQDKAGTAQGNWYDKSGSAPSYQGIDEASLLAIAHWNLDPSRGVISVGTDLIPSDYLGTQLLFTPQSSGSINREPSQVTPDGNVYCFDGPAGAGGQGPETYIDIRLDSATKLEADYGPGACSTTPQLSSNAVTYER